MASKNARKWVKTLKKACTSEREMYRKEKQLEFTGNRLYFQGELDAKNRWVILADIIPWTRIEKEYEKNFHVSAGAPAKSSRMAFGALYIKERLGISDEELVEQLRENPYLQYFIGMKDFRKDAPFDPSMMVYFRKRLKPEDIARINEWIHEEHGEAEGPEDGEGGNKGHMIADATCAPQDIRFPTDVDLLNEVREKTEKIIDRLHGPLVGKEPKARTYRKKARKAYLRFIKKRRPKEKDVRRALREQLGFVKRNLRHIKEISGRISLERLTKKEYRDLLVASEVVRQQEYMWREKTKKLSGRIVSVSQPHVRPIVRGKAAAPVEFGAKISVSLVNGYGFVEKIGWEPFNESGDLAMQIERYKERFGYYPEAVIVDKIYRTRKNREYCRERGIRISGPALGRPIKDKMRSREDIRKNREDEALRVAIEGKIGQVKRRFSLGCIYEKLKTTSETAIMLSFLVANCEKIMRDLLFGFILFLKRIALRWLSRWKLQLV
jgi:hypothetical protein